MKPVEVTNFQQRVYDALMKIPKGRVTTYQEIAHHLGMRSPRAIGQALKKNPFAPEVPCHRVIRSDGSIGGYAGKTEGEKIRKKRKLLESEGVIFDKKGVLARSESIFQF
ncbi:MAG: MGMT family protein [Verrucomicrobiota bacterium]